MKKVMKALALALALCMVLSVSAFAAVGKSDATVNKTTHVVDFNITGVGTEQVALLILKNGVIPSAATEDDILFIDQTAGINDTATFSATIAEGNDVVDVYVGSTSIAADKGSAWAVYPNLEVAETSSITIAQGTGDQVVKILAPGTEDGQSGTVQYGVAIKMSVNNLGISKMIWAFGDGATSEKKVYSKAITLNYDATAIEGDTWFTAAVAPSIIGDADNQLSTLATVNAIFLDSEGGEHFTDDADKKD